VSFAARVTVVVCIAVTVSMLMAIGAVTMLVESFLQALQ